VERGALLGQPQRPGAALDQPYAEALFQLANAAGQRRLRCRGGATGGAEAAVLGDQIEIGNRGKVHLRSSFETWCPNLSSCAILIRSITIVSIRMQSLHRAWHRFIAARRLS
jgi:hypothetical protein